MYVCVLYICVYLVWLLCRSIHHSPSTFDLICDRVVMNNVFWFLFKVEGEPHASRMAFMTAMHFV